jgi:hypothetical protein
VHEGLSSLLEALEQASMTLTLEMCLVSVCT